MAAIMVGPADLGDLGDLVDLVDLGGQVVPLLLVILEGPDLPWGLWILVVLVVHYYHCHL